MNDSTQQFFSYFDHTSDLGIEVIGDSLPDLFANSATALFSQIVDIKTIREIKSYKFKLKNDDLELLLRDWLGELLTFYFLKNVLLKSFKISGMTKNSINAIALGEKCTGERHTIIREIKSVTYHQLSVKDYQLN